MRKARFLFLSFFLLTSVGLLKAQLQSTYLQNPNSAIDVITNEVDFWANYQDNVNGGFYNEVDQNNNYNAYAQKSFSSNSRLAYAFVRAFMVTGDMEYLNKARHALNFLYDYAWDSQNDGWYYAANADGSNPQHNTYHNGKWSYMQHYGLLGIAALNEATDGNKTWADGRESDKVWLNRGLNSVYTHLWDDRAGIEGFFDFANHDWSNPKDKGFTPTADGLTTHATVMALRDIDDLYKNSFFTLADRVANEVIPTSYTSSSPLIYEYADQYWQPFGEELFNGHAIKCAWNLSRAYLMDPSKTIYKTKAQQVLDELLARGYYDDTYGGVHYFKQGGQKSHWTQEQAILAGILAYYITDDPEKKQSYIDLADGSWKFMEDYMLDFTNGGSYTDVGTDGTISYGKGDYWEAGYHTTETAYYTYLYGNIYLYNQPVDLYYYFESTGTAQVQKLTPLAIGENDLSIESVTLDGVPFTNFNSTTRELNIAANEGGVFKVTFTPNTNAVSCPSVYLGADKSICGASEIILDPGIATDNELTFAWYKNGILLQTPDMVTNTLSITESGEYKLEVSKDGCSRYDIVSITEEIPSFSLGVDQAYAAPIEISTNLDGTNAHTWYKDGTVISGETSNTLTVTSHGVYRAEVNFATCGISSDEITFYESIDIPFTANSITIDGTKDASFTQSLTVSKTVLGTHTEADLSANFSTLWDNTNLYVYVSVTDDNLSNSGSSWWANDGVEVYVDGDNSKGSSYDKQNDFQWGFVWNSTQVYAGGNNPSNSTANITHQIIETANGYNVEVAIPWATIGVTPAEGNAIGLEIGVNDNDGSGRDAKIMWETTVDDSWQNPSLFASINLSSGEPQDLKPVANAGNDQSLTLPVDQITLTGTATSGDGPLTYNWTTSSSATITNANTLTPTVSGINTVGTFTFTLTVTDADGDISTDEVTITTSPAPIAVTSVSIDQTNLSVEIGQTVQLSATVLPIDADNKNITWTSNNAYATVNASGLVTAVSAGTSIITVETEDGGFTATVTITVTEPAPIAVTSVSIDQTNQSVEIGQTVQLSATVLPIDADNKNITWTSNNTNATVNASGLVTAVSAGTSIITVETEDGGYTSTITITVTEPAPISVTSVSIDQADLSIEIGQTVQLSATVLPIDADNKNITWTSNNTNATVNASGLVTAVSAGTSIITVETEDGGYTSTITITITEPAPIAVTSVSIDQADLSIEIGQTVQLSATVLPIDADNKNITWTSNNANATVDASGLVTAVSAGTSIITVETEDGGFTSNIIITTTDGSALECSTYILPDLANWTIVNNWNDGNSGSKLLNTSEALVFNHRPWGYGDAFIIQHGQSSEIVAGQTYTLSLDIKDEQSRISSVKIGMCTGFDWNKPTGIIVPLTEVDPGFSGTNFTSKSVSVTATGSSANAYFVIYFEFTSTQGTAQNYHFKNVSVCEDQLKSNYVKEEETVDIETSISVHPVPAKNTITVTYEGNEDFEGNEIAIFNVLGTKVMSVSADQGKTTINISTLPIGTYTVSFAGTQKVIIKQ